MSKPAPPSPGIGALPIPPDSPVTSKWPAQMVEMADHIGAYATLKIIDWLGGREIYVPRDPELSPFRKMVGRETVEILSEVYGMNRLELPVARPALNEARYRPVIEKIREGDMTVAEGARLLGCTVRFVSKLVNAGEDGKPVRRSRRHSDERQIDMFDA